MSLPATDSFTDDGWRVALLGTSTGDAGDGNSPEAKSARAQEEDRDEQGRWTRGAPSSDWLLDRSGYDGWLLADS